MSSAVREGSRAPSAIYLSAGLLATGAYFLLPLGAAQDIYFILLGLSAVAAVAIGVLINRPGRLLPWWLVASGLVMVTAGVATIAVYQYLLRVAEYPFPSVSDALYIGAYPLLAAGLLLMRGRGIAQDRAGLIDPIIVATGVGVVYWTFLLGPVADAYRLSLAQRLVNGVGRQGGKIAVLFVDLDDFKSVNDSFGHEAGDQLLTAVADRLRSCLRPADTAARLGGDEFAVLLEDVEGAGEAVRVAQRIHGALRAPFALGTHEAFVEASIGVALEGAEHLRPGELLRKADRALYGAKREGKGRYSVASPSSEPITGRG